MTDATSQDPTPDLDAVLRAARDDLHAQTAAPYHQERREAFLRKLANGEPRSPYFTHEDVRLLPDHEPTPKVWGEEADRLGDALDATRRALSIARDGSDPAPDLDAFRVAVTRGDRPRYDDLSDDHLTVLYELIARGQREVWERQATELARQAKEIGERDAAITRFEARTKGFKARIAQLRDLLTELSSGEPCELDVRGWCQPHSWYEALPCPHGEAREILAAPDWDTSVIHHTSCPEHTGYRVCYCDCPTCRPGGVCACGHCKERHPGHTTKETT